MLGLNKGFILGNISDNNNNNNNRLDRHIKAVHEKMANYQCKECVYASARKDGLERHIKAVHEKSKNYRCDECEYASSRSDRLGRHYVAVHKHNQGGTKVQKYGDVMAAKTHGM